MQVVRVKVAAVQGMAEEDRATVVVVRAVVGAALARAVAVRGMAVAETASSTRRLSTRAHC